MMGGVSPETCWASYKYRIIKNFDTLLHLVGFFFMNCTVMDGSMNVKYTLYDFRTTTKSRDDAFLRTYPRLEATHDLSD